MRAFYPILLIMTLNLSTESHAQPLTGLLPTDMEAWTLVRSDTIYTAENLYDYINGGAELYLSYNMIEVASRIIAKDLDEIRIEIFDMREAGNAFGVFSHTRTKDEQEYGQGSQYFTGAQIFWKGKYFVSITANDENDEIRETIRRIAKQIDSKISESGTVPDIVGLIPQEDLISDGYLYFHHYIWLNAYYYISSENILNITDDTHAVLAKYGNKDNRSFLLIIEYPGTEEADAANSRFSQELYEGDANPQELPDHTWSGSILYDNFLAAVFNAGSVSEAENLLQSAKKMMSNQ